MNARDTLLYRSLLTQLVLMAAVCVLEAMIPAIRPLLWTGIPYLLLTMGALHLVRIGLGKVAAGLLIGLGMPMFAVQLATTGGSFSPWAAYLTITAMTAWSWLGARAAFATMGVLTLGLLVGDHFGPPPLPRPPMQLMTSYAASIVIAFGFVWMVMRDLRAAAETAWRGAHEAEQSAAAASAADEARDRFLATVSHELRTPLDAILGYAELLREEEIDADRVQDLGRIHSAGRQLLMLVDDLLDMSRVRTDELTLRFELLSVSSVLEEVVQTTKPLATARGNQLVVRLPDELPRLLCDRGRLRQILLNLVSNSIKYTHQGEIALEAELLGGALALSVRDAGIGIPPDKLSHLFRPFVQLHEGPDRRPGVGLGLALSQQLAAHLGGHIEATSTVGKGSTFTLFLPLLRDGRAG